MKIVVKSMLAFMIIIATSCSSTQSLQEYYVDNSENPNFISLDVPTSILKLENADLTEVEKEALGSLKKLNILAFKKTAENMADYKLEKANVKAILANDDFTDLMKMNTDFGRASVKFKGEEDAIEEVVIFGDNSDKGFALVRVLGKDMNPAHFVQLLQAIQKSDYDGKGLEELGDFLKS